METKKPLLIRADASVSMGTGHVMRMIALAQAYRRRGGDVTLATAICPQGMVERVKSCGVAHRALLSETPGSVDDATETSKIASELGARWLVVDGYHFSHAYQKAIRHSGLSLLCTDDHGYSDRWHCDAILNQNLDAEKWGAYDNDLPNCKLLLGSSFCLLREEFIDAGQRITRKEWGKIEHLLVTLGGSDPENSTEATLNLLKRACPRRLKIRVLVGSDNPHIECLSAFQSQHDMEIMRNAADMPSQIAWADGIISAGGSTCWEWLNAGLPGTLVTQSENQVPSVRALTETRKAALSLGWFSEFDSGKIEKKLAAWLDDPASMASRESSQAMLDGRGADRVAAFLDGKLRIGILTASQGWLLDHMALLKDKLMEMGHHVRLSTTVEDLRSGDVLLILSFWGMLSRQVLSKHCHNIVVHESALPKGKGWSPMTWQILEGKSEIPVTLFEAIEKVDAGPVYARDLIRLKGHELISEIRAIQAETTFDLCRKFVADYPAIVTSKADQAGEESTYLRRGPEDSMLDPQKTIADNFDLLRVADNVSYPAFFYLRDNKYILRIEKAPLNHGKT